MKKKRAAGVFFSLMLTAGLLAGCGGNQQGGSSSGGNSGGGGGGDVIKIGANLELSGGAASYGQSIAEGLDLALEEINKEGINGKKLELVKVDNKSEAAEATNGAIKLISQDKVVAIIGSATSTNTLAQVQIANDNKVPIITPSGTSETVTVKDGKVNEFVFRTCFIDPFQGTVAAKFALNDLKVKKAAVFDRQRERLFERAGGVI